jgi:hypothetical protein
MGLSEKLPDSQRESTSVTRRSVERMCQEWADAERRIRRSMRIYPQKLRTIFGHRTELERDIDDSDLRLPTGGRAGSADSEDRKAIISIYGKDVE